MKITNVPLIVIIMIWVARYIVLTHKIKINKMTSTPSTYLPILWTGYRMKDKTFSARKWSICVQLQHFQMKPPRLFSISVNVFSPILSHRDAFRHTIQKTAFQIIQINSKNVTTSPRCSLSIFRGGGILVCHWHSYAVCFEIVRQRKCFPKRRHQHTFIYRNTTRRKPQ